MPNCQIEIETNVSAWKRVAWSQGEKALTQVGIDAQRNVAALCPVDTGLLRNSITYALAGKEPAKKTYKATKGDGQGAYEGTLGTQNELAVYIGTNVEYAPYQEYGDFEHKHGQWHYIRDGITDHIGEYKEVINKILEEGVSELALGKGIASLLMSDEEG